MSKIDLQPIIEEVEYYKKGGKVKKLRVKPLKVKPKKPTKRQAATKKDGINIYIDNSRKTHPRSKSQGQGQRQVRSQPNIISISNPQPSSNNGLNPESFLKLLEKLGEKVNINQPQQFVKPQPKLDDIPVKTEDEPGYNEDEEFEDEPGYNEDEEFEDEYENPIDEVEPIAASGAAAPPDEKVEKPEEPVEIEKPSSSSSKGPILNQILSVVGSTNVKPIYKYDKNLLVEDARGIVKEYLANSYGLESPLFKRDGTLRSETRSVLMDKYGLKESDYKDKSMRNQVWYDIYKKIHGK